MPIQYRIHCRRLDRRYLMGVYCRLAAPVALRQELHLDAILGAAATAGQTIDRLTDLRSLRPLHTGVAEVEALGSRIACASAAFPVGREELDGAEPPHPDPVPLPGPGQAETWARGGSFVRRKDAYDIEARAARWHPGMGPGKARRKRFRELAAPGLGWLAYGDPVRLAELLYGGLIKAVGPYRSMGYGRLAAAEPWSIRPVAAESGLRPSHAFRRRGTAARVLPAAWCDAMACWPETLACEGPYWHPGRQIPACPAGVPVELLANPVGGALDNLDTLDVEARAPDEQEPWPAAQLAELRLLGAEGRRCRGCGAVASGRRCSRCQAAKRRGPAAQRRRARRDSQDSQDNGAA